jgi:transposase
MKKGMEMVSLERSEGERSEPSRSGGETISIAPADPEVESKSRHRKFSAAYKCSILAQTDKGGSGAIASILRREGLYSSHLTTWRRLRAKGELAGLEPCKRGKKPLSRNPLSIEVNHLTQDNQRLKKRLKQAEIIIDVQKKLCDLMGLTVPLIEMNESDE